MLVTDASLAPPAGLAWPSEVPGREVEETLAPKMSLAQWVADSGDSADSPGSGPGDRVIREQGIVNTGFILLQGRGAVTLELSQEGSRHSGKCVVRRFPGGLLCV